MRFIFPALVIAALSTGCYATTGGYVGVEATTVAPDLVFVSPGVQVIADYDEPVFYSDGFYWREMNGGWYRSSYHTGGWAYAAPPRAVLSIGNRHSYSHYRPAGYVRRDHRSEPAYRGRDNRPVYRNQPGPTVRDHRSPPPAAVRTAPAPTVRDHRAPEKKKVEVRDHR